MLLKHMGNPVHSAAECLRKGRRIAYDGSLDGRNAGCLFRAGLAADQMVPATK
ncbi:hypothetical protein ANACOL_00378 [Anaerotruncus colihominis DSM 17241]|uniref:Uncharacterized protein n=1 Tax=Anaerotruncus colihominis DSM 17241 TaxID=445972 RepID=B0P6K0_9FIRM|nr:hypothetical protein ANACOL_00378 [Anaerotruncus colihominis DSM 17241]